MEAPVFLMIFAVILATVFSLVALVRRIRKKAYVIPLRISGICFGGGIASLLIAVSGGRWNMIMMFAAILLIIYGIYQAIVLVIRKIRKKDTRRSKLKASAALGAGLCAAIVSISRDLASALEMFAAVFLLVAPVMLVINVGRALFKKKNKLLWLLAPACLAASIVLFLAADYSWNHQLEKRTASGEIYEEPIQITYDFEVVDGSTPIEIVTSRCLDLPGRKSIYVYDEKDLYLALTNDYVTADQCIEAIQSNEKIEPRFKAYFCDFIERLEETYPGLNLAVLYQNLETLDVQELSASDYLWESLSVNSLGCYNKRKNTIFIPEGTEYTEGEFGFQVLLHEFCHAVRSGEYESDNIKRSFGFYEDSDNILLSEAMNSVFSCSLLNYYEWNIAYQVPSNYLRIMLECMDNYSLEDYIKHSDMYFLSKLDEFMGRTNYAQVIWKLITLQRSDWEQENVDIPVEEYHLIYDFLCEMYYKKYITGSMTYEEQKAVADELIHKAFFDAPENYKIDPDYFYEYLGL